VFLAWKGVVARHRALNASAALFFQDSLRRQQQQQQLAAAQDRSGTESGKAGADAGQSNSFSVTTAVRDHNNFAFTVHWSSVLAAADELRARVWRRWRARFLQQRQQSALLTLNARAALRAWTRRAEWSRRLESVEQLVNERYRLRLLADVVDTWAARTASRRSLAMLSAAVDRIAARLQKRTKLHWLRLPSGQHPAPLRAALRLLSLACTRLSFTCCIVRESNERMRVACARQCAREGTRSRMQFYSFEGKDPSYEQSKTSSSMRARGEGACERMHT
jgi:hypothetical protein